MGPGAEPVWGEEGQHGRDGSAPDAAPGSVQVGGRPSGSQTDLNGEQMWGRSPQPCPGVRGWERARWGGCGVGRGLMGWDGAVQRGMGTHGVGWSGVMGWGHVGFDGDMGWDRAIQGGIGTWGGKGPYEVKWGHGGMGQYGWDGTIWGGMGPCGVGWGHTGWDGAAVPGCCVASHREPPPGRPRASAAPPGREQHRVRGDPTPKPLTPPYPTPGAHPRDGAVAQRCPPALPAPRGVGAQSRWPHAMGSPPWGGARGPRGALG